MSYRDIPPITPELWVSNLIGVAKDIANREQQERRWLDPNRHPWERPEELISELFDAYNLDLFLKQFAASFSAEQRDAAIDLRDRLNEFCEATPTNLDAAETLADPRWGLVRQKASAFVMAFDGKWPSAS
jgi:hypothetical protein